MKKQRRCIRITSTRTGKLRAQVEQDVSTDPSNPFIMPRFEVTLGGKKWASLPLPLQEAIYKRAQAYVHHLSKQLIEVRSQRVRALIEEEGV